MTNIVYNKNGIKFDIDALDSYVNGKADVDLTNVNNSAKEKIVQYFLPSSTYSQFTLQASNSTYTAPADGWMYFYSESVCNSVLFNTTKGYGSTAVGASGYTNHNLLPVSAGDIVRLTYSTSTGSSLKFFYTRGNEHKA